MSFQHKNAKGYHAHTHLSSKRGNFSKERKEVGKGKIGTSSTLISIVPLPTWEGRISHNRVMGNSNGPVGSKKVKGE